MEQTVCSETSAHKNSDAGQLPKRKNTMKKLLRRPLLAERMGTQTPIWG